MTQRINRDGWHFRTGPRHISKKTPNGRVIAVGASVCGEGGGMIWRFADHPNEVRPLNRPEKIWAYRPDGDLELFDEHAELPDGYKRATLTREEWAALFPDLAAMVKGNGRSSL